MVKDIKLNKNTFLSMILDEDCLDAYIQMSFYDEVVGVDISLSQMEEIVRELNNIIRIKRRPFKAKDKTINELLDEKFGKGEWTR